MRALIISIALLIASAICTGFLTIFAGIGLGSAAFALLGLFMVGSLFAAISALGPKWSPTPFLTPTLAGTMAVVVTAAVIAGTAKIGKSERTALNASEPPKVNEQAPMESPAMPQSPGAPVRMAEPALPSAADGAQPALPPMAPAAIEEPQDAMPLPALETANSSDLPFGPDFEIPPLQIAPPLSDEPVPAVPTPESGGANPMLATNPPADLTAAASPLVGAPPAADTTAAPTGAAVPVPSPRPSQPSASASQPPSPTSPLPGTPQPAGAVALSQDSFDPSATPTALPATSAPTAIVNPPLPRNRPCGAGGPPCP